MAMSARLIVLLNRWIDLEAQGVNATPEDLCADCPELIEEVRGHLQSLFDSLPSTGPGTPPVGGTPAGAGRLAETPAWAGPTARYQPVRLHAQGGLGEVFVAEDAELHRQVALKRVRAHCAHDPESRRRFLLEAEITGKLEHPGVVPVYGLGQDAEGQPCYAMRFIQGETLQDAINRFHQADQQPRRDPGERRLEFRGLLNRLVAVCNTVAYAHSRGVLHRDLKPANIMLGRYGETLVLDWGLAKSLARRAEDQAGGEEALTPSPATAGSGTQTGQLMGTPAYMSPEQAAGHWDQVGPASDIYSLGATLYAVLTGQPPFRGKPDLEKIRAGKLAPPRQVTRKVPRPLEAVCLKALAHRPEERYRTARLLADDLEHWLADEPVTAYREPLATRLGRWGRRHRSLLVSVGALLLTAVAALTIGLIAVNREKIRAEQALTREAQAKKRARQALDEMSSRVIDNWLSRQPGKLEPDQKEFLQKALGYYQEFAREAGDSEAVRAGVAQAHLRVGNIHHKLGQYPEAEAAFRRAIDLCKQLAAAFPAVTQYRQDLAVSHNSLGILLHDLSRLQEAERAFQDALAIRKQLAADFTSVPQYRQDLAGSYNNLGLLLAAMGRFQDAEGAYRGAIAIKKQLAADFSSSAEYRQDLSRSYNNLGMLLQTTGRPQAAEGMYQEALALRKQLAAEFPTMPTYRRQLARGYNNLGMLLQSMGRLQAAEAAFQDALTIFKRLAAGSPSVPQYRRELAAGHYNLGLLLRVAGRTQEAERAFQDALALRKQLATEFPAVPHHRQELANSYTMLGILLHDLDRVQDAERAYRDALAIQKPLTADFPAIPRYRRDLASNYNNLGNLQRDTGRSQEAEMAYREALALQKQLTSDFPTVSDYQSEWAGTMNNLAKLFIDRHQFAQAHELLEQAAPHHQAALKANPKNSTYRNFYSDNRSFLAMTRAGLGDRAAAFQMAEQLTRLSRTAAAGVYNAACTLSLCIPLVEKNEKLSAAQRQEQATAYADRAMALLRQAVTQGYRNAAHMKKDKDLDPLRQRADFQKLLEELAKPQPQSRRTGPDGGQADN